MCGIVGIVTKSKTGLFKTQADMFSQLIFADQLRGTDGTGLFYNRKKKCIAVKHPATASLMFGQKQYKNALSDAVQNGDFLIGHNRAATKGNKIWKDTHPFVEDNITLIHNGTLFNHHKLNKNSDVDSHAIAVHMAKNGHIKTLKEVDGPFALVWFDQKEQTLNFCRNNQRPLSIVETDNCWLISSEAGLAQWIAERNNLKITSTTNLESEHVYSFKEHDYSKLLKEKVTYFNWSGITSYGGTYKGNYSGIYSNFDDGIEYDTAWPKQNSTKETRPEVIPHSSVVSNVAYERKQGDYIKFKADKKYVTGEATYWDSLINKEYFRGIPEGETKAYIRIYCSREQAKEYEKTDRLIGQIISITFKADGYTYYTLDKATAIFDGGKKEIDNREFCSECATIIEENEMEDSKKTKTGGWMCPLCVKEEEEKLARYGLDYNLMGQC